MLTLTQSEWNPDVFNSASFVGGIATTLVFAALIWFAWRVSVGPFVERVRRERVDRARAENAMLRDQIRAEVIAALNSDSDADDEVAFELDPDDFEEDDGDAVPGR